MGGVRGSLVLLAQSIGVVEGEDLSYTRSGVVTHRNTRVTESKVKKKNLTVE